jgi:hypothetical protein
LIEKLWRRGAGDSVIRRKREKKNGKRMMEKEDREGE